MMKKIRIGMIKYAHHAQSIRKQFQAYLLDFVLVRLTMTCIFML